MTNKKNIIGEAIDRIDGFLKVTGRADYSTDFRVDNVAYGYLFKSETAAGKILDIDARDAEKSPGVIMVITHQNAPKLNVSRAMRGGAILQDANIEYYGENIGVVIAETFEQARYAAGLVRVTYEKTEARVDFDKLAASAVKSKDRTDAMHGDFETAFARAEVKFDEIYNTPIEHHHPMAPHATTAVWDAPDKLTIYNESQIVNGVQGAIASVFALPPKNVRVITPHIGGGFGSKGGAWGHVVIAALAAKMVKRPVKLALTRQMMFNSVGMRQRNIQRLRLGAGRDGKLIALAHDTTTHTAIDDEFIEPCGDVSEHMYDAPNMSISYRVAPMNVLLPTYTRAPGKSTGSFALESAIDELAHKLKMDPIELRIKNEPEKDPSNGKPWSSRSLVEALRKGAEAFGWDKRKPVPRANREGELLIGYGVGCGTYPVRFWPTSARVKLRKENGGISASIELAASDLGTGTYTIIAQTAAQTLQMPLNRVGVKIGDSDLPPAAGSVGSVGAASFSNAVFEACEQCLRELQAKTNQEWFVAPTAEQLMEAAKLDEYETTANTRGPEIANNYSANSFNANFAEVAVDESTGMTRVRRLVAATAAGRILNPKTANSQIIGGGIWGIGQALTEESLIDPKWGNFVTRTFADYHIPANLDIGQMETIFIREDDKIVNKLGVKGIGEVSIVGVAAAVANSIFNATGKRIRDLPITPDKLMNS